nr:3789_t:CDS:2 [Entrophospora candida]
MSADRRKEKNFKRYLTNSPKCNSYTQTENFIEAILCRAYIPRKNNVRLTNPTQSLHNFI